MIASLAALLLGILIAVQLHEPMANLLDGIFSIDEEYLLLVGFAVTFVLIVLIVHLIAFFIDKVVNAIALSLINRILGMAFGLLVTAFVISIIITPLSVMNVEEAYIEEETVEGSLLFEPLASFAPSVFPYIDRELIRELAPIRDSIGTKGTELINEADSAINKN